MWLVCMISTCSQNTETWHRAPNFRGTIFSQISWVDFRSRTFSHEILVLSWAWLRSVCTCIGASQARSCIHVRMWYSERVNCQKWSIESLLNSVQTIRLVSEKEQKLPTKFARTFVQTIPSSCIESANNHVEEMAKQTTTEGAKGREARISLI